MHRGYIKIWRKIKDSGLYQMPETLTLFMFILTEATHQPRRVGNTLLQRGQYSSGRIELARQLKQSEQTIRTGLDRLKKLEIITIETTSHGSIYTIVNYGIYQDVDQTNNQQANQQSTSEQPTTNQPLTSKQPHNKHINTKTHKHISTKEYSSAAFALPYWINREHWDIWVKSRKKMNPAQKQMQVDKLKAWKDDGLDYAGALANAAANGTQGLFLPNNGKQISQSRTNVQDARLSVAQQIMGGMNGANRKVIDITPRSATEGNRASIPETIDGVREPDASKVAGD